MLVGRRMATASVSLTILGDKWGQGRPKSNKKPQQAKVSLEGVSECRQTMNKALGSAEPNSCIACHHAASTGT